MVNIFKILQKNKKIEVKTHREQIAEAVQYSLNLEKQNNQNLRKIVNYIKEMIVKSIKDNIRYGELPIGEYIFHSYDYNEYHLPDSKYHGSARSLILDTVRKELRAEDIVITETQQDNFGQRVTFKYTWEKIHQEVYTKWEAGNGPSS